VAPTHVDSIKRSVVSMISVVQPDGHADGGLAVRPVLLGLEDVAPDEVLDPAWLTLRPMIKIFCRKVTVYGTKFRVLCRQNIAK